MNPSATRISVSGTGGFTLVELMVAVMIAGILAMIALPSYTEYVRRGYRADARGMMLEAAQQLERFRSVNGRYDQSPGGVAFALPAALQNSPRDSAQVRYTISVVALTDSSYTLQAAPADATDACGTYLLDQTGNRQNLVGGVVGPAIANCWLH